jgi:hypothetical protein
MNGKGSKPRPIKNYKSFAKNWERAFRRQKKKSK